MIRQTRVKVYFFAHRKVQIEDSTGDGTTHVLPSPTEFLTLRMFWDNDLCVGSPSKSLIAREKCRLLATPDIDGLTLAPGSTKYRLFQRAAPLLIPNPPIRIILLLPTAIILQRRQQICPRKRMSW